MHSHVYTHSVDRLGQDQIKGAARRRSLNYQVQADAIVKLIDYFLV